MYGLWGSTYRFSSSVLSSLELWERDAAMPLTHRPATSGCSFPYERLENDSNDQESSQVQGSRSSANCAWLSRGPHPACRVRERSLRGLTAFGGWFTLATASVTSGPPRRSVPGSRGPLTQEPLLKGTGVRAVSASTSPGPPRRSVSGSRGPLTHEPPHI